MFSKLSNVEAIRETAAEEMFLVKSKIISFIKSKDNCLETCTLIFNNNSVLKAWIICFTDKAQVDNFRQALKTNYRGAVKSAESLLEINSSTEDKVYQYYDSQIVINSSKGLPKVMPSFSPTEVKFSNEVSFNNLEDITNS
jgi:hypothetical protein